MKKIFTLVAAAVMALAANAAEFTDNLSINVFGETTSQEATVVVEEVAGSDGTYDITLKDFSFGTFNLGDIKMENVKGNSDSEGFVNFEKTETSITIAIGNADVTINEGSRMKGDKLYMDMDISAMGGAITVEAVFGDNDFTSTGISRPTIVVDNGVEAIYDLNGRKLNEMQKGINIVRKADGTTVKVLKK